MTLDQIVGGLILAAILLMVLAVIRPAARRPVAAVLVLIVAVLAAGFVSIVGAFTCYDCSSRPLEPIFNGVAIIVLVVAVVLALRIALGGRRRARQ
jgi:uncharacterized membrane protein